MLEQYKVWLMGIKTTFSLFIVAASRIKQGVWHQINKQYV